MSDDVLSNIDAAVEATREERCACGCRRRVTADSPSPYFAGQDCQTSWNLQQQAIANGEPERAEEMRQQRGEDPIDRLRRRVRELSPRDEEREAREWRRARIADWLCANGINPERVAADYPIITTPTSITVHDYTRDEDDRPCLVDGEVATVEQLYPLRVAWPFDLDYEHHRFELDEDEGDADRRRGEVFASVGGVTRILGREHRLDAIGLTYDHPYLYRVRCTGCGRRGTPINAECQLMADGSVRTHWTCDCGTYVTTADVTATVERFTQADGLHLRLGYGREMVHYVLPEHQLDRYDSLDPIWREMEQLVATSVRLPWSDPRSNPLRDVREVAERAYQRGAGTVSVAPVDTPPNWDGWLDLGWTTDDGLRADEEVVVGFDGAGEDAALAIARAYHDPVHGRVTAIDVSAPTHDQFASRWREIFQRIQVNAERTAAAMCLVGLVVRDIGEAMSPMRRAIEAKKNRAHGPQQKKRAPRRIDPRRGR